MELKSLSIDSIETLLSTELKFNPQRWFLHDRDVLNVKAVRHFLHILSIRQVFAKFQEKKAKDSFISQNKTQESDAKQDLSFFVAASIFGECLPFGTTSRECMHYDLAQLKMTSSGVPFEEFSHLSQLSHQQFSPSLLSLSNHSIPRRMAMTESTTTITSFVEFGNILKVVSSPNFPREIQRMKLIWDGFGEVSPPIQSHLLEISSFVQDILIVKACHTMDLKEASRVPSVYSGLTEIQQSRECKTYLPMYLQIFKLDGVDSMVVPSLIKWMVDVELNFLEKKQLVSLIDVNLNLKYMLNESGNSSNSSSSSSSSNSSNIGSSGSTSSSSSSSIKPPTIPILSSFELKNCIFKKIVTNLVRQRQCPHFNISYFAFSPNPQKNILTSFSEFIEGQPLSDYLKGIQISDIAPYFWSYNRIRCFLWPFFYTLYTLEILGYTLSSNTSSVQRQKWIEENWKLKPVQVEGYFQYFIPKTSIHDFAQKQKEQKQKEQKQKWKGRSIRIEKGFWFLVDISPFVPVESSSSYSSAHSTDLSHLFTQMGFPVIEGESSDLSNPLLSTSILKGISQEEESKIITSTSSTPLIIPTTVTTTDLQFQSNVYCDFLDILLQHITSITQNLSTLISSSYFVSTSKSSSINELEKTLTTRRLFRVSEMKEEEKSIIRLKKMFRLLNLYSNSPGRRLAMLSSILSDSYFDLRGDSGEILQQEIEQEDLPEVSSNIREVEANYQYTKLQEDYKRLMNNMQKEKEKYSDESRHKSSSSSSSSGTSTIQQKQLYQEEGVQRTNINQKKQKRIIKKQTELIDKYNTLPCLGTFYWSPKNSFHSELILPFPIESYYSKFHPLTKSKTLFQLQSPPTSSLQSGIGMDELKKPPEINIESFINAQFPNIITTFDFSNLTKSLWIEAETKAIEVDLADSTLHWDVFKRGSHVLLPMLSEFNPYSSEISIESSIQTSGTRKKSQTFLQKTTTSNKIPSWMPFVEGDALSLEDESDTVSSLASQNELKNYLSTLQSDTFNLYFTVSAKRLHQEASQEWRYVVRLLETFPDLWDTLPDKLQKLGITQEEIKILAQELKSKEFKEREWSEKGEDLVGFEHQKQQQQETLSSTGSSGPLFNVSEEERWKVEEGLKNLQMETTQKEKIQQLIKLVESLNPEALKLLFGPMQNKKKVQIQDSDRYIHILKLREYLRDVIARELEVGISRGYSLSYFSEE